MAENKMKQVAELLDVEIGEPFYVKSVSELELTCNPFVFKSDGLYDKHYNRKYSIVLNNLLNGVYEIEKPILTPKEKAYLEGMLRPFKDRVKYIKKENHYSTNKVYLSILIKNDHNINFPDFEENTMYKGIEINKEYTIEELGLFEDENRRFSKSSENI